jgi:hypothetical protein
MYLLIKELGRLAVVVFGVKYSDISFWITCIKNYQKNLIIE